MRIRNVLLLILLTGCGIIIAIAVNKTDHPNYKTAELPEPAGCVFNTLFGEETSDSFFIFQTPEKAGKALRSGLDWIASAQLENGGFGAGSHSAQHIRDPHAVAADPATTSMVAMAILRTEGLQSENWGHSLDQAIQYLIKTVNEADPNHPNITSITGTQIQSKLGQNIDVVMTAQFFSNLLQEKQLDSQLKERVKDALQECVNRIQGAQDENGVIKNSGWAGVLQSAYANNALESADVVGIKVDQEALDKSRDFQQNNVNPGTGDVKTDLGAGVMLYSVSGSSRASAKKAREARHEIDKAKKEGKLDKDDEVNISNLRAIGLDEEDALQLATSYDVYESAKVTAQSKAVMNGYGSNGGEEFLSFLQTGESLVVNRDNGWKNWYSDISGKLISIQNQDGSWSGHHCITSPVFCTATCLLILSVQNDLEQLVKIGEN